MNESRFRALTSSYSKLRMAVVGDFCLDRYLEIDTTKDEVSIETGLSVYNVTRVRSQPGGAGTILSNLVELGIKEVFAVGFCGEDGEGWELRKALLAMRGVRADHFVTTAQRRTFTYTKPLLMSDGSPPMELNRLDIKNWSPTSPSVIECVQRSISDLAQHVDALVVLDQVDIPGTGVVTENVLATIDNVSGNRGDLLVLADSRRGLSGFPKVTFKMNDRELAKLLGEEVGTDVQAIERQSIQLAKKQEHPVFITLAERGILGSSPSGESRHVAAHPVRGKIDIVGAGDAVTANLAAALAAGASLEEAVELANAAASVVIHQLGTTGTASVERIKELLVRPSPSGGPKGSKA